MGFDPYHEPAHDLPEEARTYARISASLTEEAQAIGWYEQRLAVEGDAQPRAIWATPKEEEFKHFSMTSNFSSGARRSGARSQRGPCSRRVTSSSVVSAPRKRGAESLRGKAYG